MWISNKNVYSRWAKSDQPPQTYWTKAVNCINFSFPRSTRILKRQHFKELARSHQRFLGKTMVINYRSSKEVKLGITVVKQFGNAVLRNLFKRRVREAFRTHRPLFKAFEFIVMPKKGTKLFTLELITKDLLEFNSSVKDLAEFKHDAQLTATKSR